MNRKVSQFQASFYSCFSIRMRQSRSQAGFTFIELLVVMVIIALLLSIVAPRYFNSIDKAKEAVLRQDLGMLRDAIDQFYSDTGSYPLSLEELVERSYLRSIPIDPLTESAETWVEIQPSNEGEEGVYDIRTGFTGKAKDGTYYEEW